MKVITIMNLKGGVGKTTTTVNMAAELAARGRFVVVIDADPQGNTTQFYSCTKNDCLTVADLLRDEIPRDVEDYIYPTDKGKIELVPASFGLVDCDIAAARGGGNRMLRRIADLCEYLREESCADFVIIDCPPGFTAASVAAIYAADDIIIPVEIDAFSLAGMKQLLHQIDSARTIQPRLRVAGALVTKYYKAPAVVQGEAMLRQSGVPVFETVIRRSDRVTEAIFQRKAMRDYSRNCPVYRNYRDLVDEYLREGAAV